jgi:hypothetical protein
VWLAPFRFFSIRERGGWAYTHIHDNMTLKSPTQQTTCHGRLYNIMVLKKRSYRPQEEKKNIYTQENKLYY